MKTSLKTRVSRMGLGSLVNINIYVMKYYLFIFSNVFESLNSNLQNVKTPKTIIF